MSVLDFQKRDFLEQHILSTLRFYQPTAFDEQGGFFHFFRNDGSVYNRHTRHLVSSTRFVFNYAMAARYFADLPELAYAKEWARHALQYVEQAHKQKDTGGYAWLLENGQVVDSTNHCYGLAFVIVAGATALLAGIEEGRLSIESAWQLMEQHFWDDGYGLYKDEANADFSIVAPYRGQNANMHACEAMLWAYEATGEQRFLQRAAMLAKNISQRQASLANGLIWEHYNEQWQIDWQYHRDNPKHLFRPWGFQAGHQTEWAKLLLILHRHQPEAWQLERAKALFDSAMTHAWDEQFGGIYYGFAPDYQVCDDDKYFWVQAESFAAAALLAKATGEAHYLEWYQRIWHYSWQYMVDHRYGAWFRILTRQNQTYDDKKSPAGKTDYHTMGACYEVLRSGLVLP